MTALVIAEHDNASVKGATLNTVTAAAAAGGEVHILVAGHNATRAAEAASKIAGVAKVLHADAPGLEHGLAENVAAQVIALAADYRHIVFPATAAGKNVAPRVAALLDVAQVSDIIKVVSPDTFERPIYAGNAIATVQSGDKVKVLTVRSTGFDPAAASGGSAAIEKVGATADNGSSSFVGSEIAKNLLARAMRDVGWLAARPNFRGVGASQGTHDAGIGETVDVLELIAQLRAVHPDLPLALIGFSFGAFVQSRVARALADRGEPAHRVVLAALPVGEVEGQRQYAPCGDLPHALIVHGENDERVGLSTVLDWARPQSQPIVLIPGADHFFTGRLPMLRELVLSHVAS